MATDKHSKSVAISTFFKKMFEQQLQEVKDKFANLDPTTYSNEELVDLYGRWLCKWCPDPQQLELYQLAAEKMKVEILSRLTLPNKKY